MDLGAAAPDTTQERAFLPAAEQLADRLERYLAVRADLRAPETVERIDLRYPNGLAVTRRSAGDEPSERLADAPGDERESKGAPIHHG